MTFYDPRSVFLKPIVTVTAICIFSVSVFPARCVAQSFDLYYRFLPRPSAERFLLRQVLASPVPSYLECLMLCTSCLVCSPQTRYPVVS